MKITKYEFDKLKKEANSCLLTPKYIKYGLKDVYLINDESGYYVFEKI